MPEPEQPSAAPLRRVPTHVRGLDEVLQGGLFSGGTYLIVGPSGSGKTVLATESCFRHAPESVAVFVTVLTEAHGRMLAYLKPFDFFDEAVVGKQVYYVSAYHVLQEEGLDGLSVFLFDLLRQHRPRLFVLDGLMNIEVASPSTVDYRQFLHDLSVLTTSVDAVTLLLDHRDASPDTSQFAMVDGVIEMTAAQGTMRTSRELQVHKLRGSAFADGRHQYRIDGVGIRVYPRAEFHASEAESSGREVLERRATGIANLDAMLGGGVASDSMTLVAGPPGSGKTLMGMRFLEAGCERGERGLMVGMYERPGHLLRMAASAGIGMEGCTERGLLDVRWRVPLDLMLDEVFHWIVDEVERTGADRLFLDGLTALDLGGFYRERLTEVFTALAYHLRGRGVTCLASIEVANLLGLPESVPLRGLSPSADNLIALRHEEVDGRRHRLLTILKTREHASDPDAHEYFISSAGIEVAASSDSARQILAHGPERGGPAER